MIRLGGGKEFEVRRRERTSFESRRLKSDVVDRRPILHASDGKGKGQPSTSKRVLVDPTSIVSGVDRVSPVGKSLSDSDLDVRPRGQDGVVVDEST